MLRKTFRLYILVQVTIEPRSLCVPFENDYMDRQYSVACTSYIVLFCPEGTIKFL